MQVLLFLTLMDIFLSIAIPSPPWIPSYTVEKYGQDRVILTVHWQSSQYDGGAPVSYTITVSPDVGTFATTGTSVPVTVPYNVIHTVSIVAINCNGSSSATMETIPAIGRLSYSVIRNVPQSVQCTVRHTDT